MNVITYLLKLNYVSKEGLCHLGYNPRNMYAILFVLLLVYNTTYIYCHS